MATQIKNQCGSLIFYQDFIGFQVKKCLKINEKFTTPVLRKQGSIIIILQRERYNAVRLENFWKHIMIDH
jgi:hypothetical protein